MNDNQVQNLIRGQFMNQMIFRIIDNARANRGRFQQQGQQVQCIKVPLIADIVGGAIILFYIALLIFVMILSVLGLIMIVFNIN